MAETEQLTVRGCTKDQIRIVRQVKDLAADRGIAIKDAAFLLLQRGLEDCNRDNETNEENYTDQELQTLRRLRERFNGGIPENLINMLEATGTDDPVTSDSTEIESIKHLRDRFDGDVSPEVVEMIDQLIEQDGYVFVADGIEQILTIYESHPDWFGDDTIRALCAFIEDHDLRTKFTHYIAQYAINIKIEPKRLPGV